MAAKLLFLVKNIVHIHKGCVTSHLAENGASSEGCELPLHPTKQLYQTYTLFALHGVHRNVSLFLALFEILCLPFLALFPPPPLLRPLASLVVLNGVGHEFVML